jgi:excisionase family DNA binding protein
MPPVPNEPTIPSAEDALLAREVTRALEGHHGDETLRLMVTAGVDDTTALELPPIAAELLIEILRQMADGNAVSVTPMKPEITTQQAAELLNVSRPFVVGLVDKGALPARMVGNQRRLPLSDVLAYRTETRAKRRSALEELSALDQELSLR